MPRTTYLDRLTPEAAEYAEELRSRYGGMMTPTDIGLELGLAGFVTGEKGKMNYISVRRFMDGVPAIHAGTRLKYRVADFAKRCFP